MIEDHVVFSLNAEQISRKTGKYRLNLGALVGLIISANIYIPGVGHKLFPESNAPTRVPPHQVVG